jgi:hypothetical protein
MRVCKRSIHLYSVFALSVALLVAGCFDLTVPPKPDTDGGAGKSGTGGKGGGVKDGASENGGSGGTGVRGGTGGSGGGADSGEDAAVDDGGVSSGSGGDSGSGGGSGGSGGDSGSGGSGGQGGTSDAEVVTDDKTGLIWMKCPAGQGGADCSSGSATTYAWQDAVDYCDALVSAGYDDWRLPEIHELVSIVDYTKFDPAIDATTFPATPYNNPLAQFWSSSSSANDVSFAWYIPFDYGEVADRAKSSTFCVRCVRSGPLVIGSFEHSVISGDRIVKDTATGLTWQGCTSGMSGESCDQGSEAKYAWQNAVDHCENLTWAGYSDWRLPEIDELISIVDYTKSDPAINETAFPAPATPSEFFWSSSSAAYSVSYAWSVCFKDGGIDDGDVGDDDKSNTYSVRCVRSGP